MSLEKLVMSERIKINAIRRAYSDLDSSSAFTSIARVLKTARKSVKSITAEDVKKYLRGVKSYTLHRKSLKTFPTRRFLTQGINYQWQSDLIVLSDKHSNLNKCGYILCNIDTFSRKLFCKELRRKTNKEVIEKFSSFIKAHGKPKNLYTDLGKEYTGVKFQIFLKKHGISHHLAYQQYHASLIERAIRSLKERIFRWMTHANSEVFIPHLQKFVTAYNNSPHRGLPDGLSPNQITTKNENYVWKKQYGPIVRKAGSPSPNLKPGQTVRITRYPETFRKGYQTRFSKEIFKITGVYPTVPPTYRIRSLSNEVIRGIFYKSELQPVTI